MAEKEKEKPNMVQQDALFIETVRKEQRLQILHTEFSFNPRKKCKKLRSLQPGSDTQLFSLRSSHVHVLHMFSLPCSL